LETAERKRYKDSNTALLFHGTRSVNVRGIMRESLRLPKQLVGVVITGAMFGPGLYFADDWKKSAGYTSMSNSYWSRGSGAVKSRGAFMFAVDTVLGQPHVADRAHGFTAPPKKHHCVYGKAGHSGVQNNEFIVFDAQQHQLKYLIEFETK
jgi:poly [ADP-ribose] polymerase